MAALKLLCCLAFIAVYGNLVSGVNIAYKKAASQSSTYGSMSKWVAAHAVDGKMTTESVTNSKAVNWLIVDLKTPVDIASKVIKVYLGDYAYRKGYYKNFKVSTRATSKDKWVGCYEVAEVKGDYSPVYVWCSGAGAMTRYIKVSVDNKRAVPLYIKEIMVEPVVLFNAAYKKAASQSSTYGSMSKWVAAHAVDGKMTTQSVTNSKAVNWLIVDLKTTVDMGKKIIKVYLGAYAAGKRYYKNFKVSVRKTSKDKWVPCYSSAEVKSAAKPVLVRCSAGNMARYVQVSVNNKRAVPLYLKEVMVVPAPGINIGLHAQVPADEPQDMEREDMAEDPQELEEEHMVEEEE